MKCRRGAIRPTLRWPGLYERSLYGLPFPDAPKGRQPSLVVQGLFRALHGSVGGMMLGSLRAQVLEMERPVLDATVVPALRHHLRSEAALPDDEHLSRRHDCYRTVGRLSGATP